MRQDNKVPALEVEAMKAVKMQIVSWHTCDYDYNADDDVNDDDANECEDGRYLIKMFGVTEEGQSVSVNVLNFTPFFFIKVVDSKKCNRLFLESLREQLVNELPFHLKASLIGVKFMRKKDFWGFHNGETFNFVRITFKSIKCYRAAIRIVQRGIRVLRFDYSKFKYPLYESNIDPFLRFIHLRDIEPAGWVSIHEYDVNSQLMPSKCQIDINAHWLKVNPCQAERMAPLVVASFDIECVSSHGDFPVARKDYKKLAYELFQLYESKKDSRDDLQEYLYDELVKVFDHEREGVLSKVFLKHELSREEVLKLRDKTKRYMEDIVNVASGKLVYRGVTSGANNGKSQGPTKDEIIKKLTSMFGYYGECDSKQLQTPEFMHAKVIDTMTNGIGADRIIYWKGMYPMLEGDPIIQIGTTVHKYGEKECSYKHILSVGTCDDIEGVVVESCETEQELLERWCDLVNRLDPDIMTGYNIYGFDMSYMYERSIELGMKSKFCRIGRLKNHESLFQEKTLSSSALGDNILKFVDMEGRVLIDVMKVVQRDHKLDSYKLDAVASHFMKMNKHDVSPNDIFRLSRGSSADRAIVADYCVQDCALCNHLMMKLEILANNVGMANVCSVPLSFIFTRGQGVKIFSLVAKQCKEDNFLIPALNKGKLDDDAPEDEDGYEGAIVLEPKTGIYTEDPISVLDYASLYPSSMISENLSHDCYVEIGGRYDNLPGIEYLDIKYDIYEKIDEKKVRAGEKVCRFVQNEKGAIPRILMKLIRQRKETRKKIEYKTVIDVDGNKHIGLLSEDDEKYTLTTIDGKKSVCLKSVVDGIEDTYNDFMKAVLDGLQSAYKVTANSLYGQIGAKTSPIYLKDIAACTTATGRNMILKAKKFLEDEYVGVNIVYGDSVSGDTPLLVKFPDGHIDIITIETLTTDWVAYDNFKPFDTGRYGKQQSFTDAKIWTDQGWQDIRRVIRHKTNKKMFRVTTYQGSVDVTEDHSLIGKDMQQIKPGECIVGETEILHSFPSEFTEYKMQVNEMKQGEEYASKFPGLHNCKLCKSSLPASKFYLNNKKKLALQCKTCIKRRACERAGRPFNETIKDDSTIYHVPAYNITKEEAWVWGLFFADGSCGYYNCNSGDKYSWGINKAKMSVLDQAKKFLEGFEPSFMKFHMIDTLASSGVYKLVPQGSIKYMVEKYRPLFYDKDDMKKVPTLILNAPREIREWFWKGYQTGDDSKLHMAQGQVSWACKGKIGAQGLLYIMKSLGYANVRVNTQHYKDNTYWVNTGKMDDYFDMMKDKVVKLHQISDVNVEDYVYDIETASGRFHGGVGSVILKNTDSLMVAFPMEFTDKNGVIRKRTGAEAIQHAIDKGMDASKKFKAYLKPPHDLEMEKVFHPFILISKKRYCAMKYESDPTKGKFSSMGVALKRRDNAPIVKKVYGGVIDIIMKEQDISKSIGFLQQSMGDLIDGKYALEDLIISKSLRADYKDPTRIAHKALAERMGERDPGNKPQVNDRIPYVYVDISERTKGKGKKEKVLQGDRIEHPEYIRKNNLKPDYEFYITNQIMKPVSQIYALVLEQVPGYKKSRAHYHDVEKKLLVEKEGDIKKVRDKIADMKEADVQDILFRPFLMKLENKRCGNRPITDFFALRG
jgi:DNA polymerase elongation subunit (family B)